MAKTHRYEPEEEEPKVKAPRKKLRKIARQAIRKGDYSALERGK